MKSDRQGEQHEATGERLVLANADRNTARCWCRPRRQYRAKNTGVDRPTICIVMTAAHRGQYLQNLSKKKLSGSSFHRSQHQHQRRNQRLPRHPPATAATTSIAEWKCSLTFSLCLKPYHLLSYPYRITCNDELIFCTSDDTEEIRIITVMARISYEPITHQVYTDFHLGITAPKAASLKAASLKAASRSHHTSDLKAASLNDLNVLIVIALVVIFFLLATAVYSRRQEWYSAIKSSTNP